MTDYKPHILTQSRFNPPDEVISIIGYCAKRGIKGKVGDVLPVGISAESHIWINKYHLVFESLISAKIESTKRLQRFHMPQTTTQEEEKPGFFSRLWGGITGRNKSQEAQKQ